jgi:hypothetical protein
LVPSPLWVNYGLRDAPIEMVSFVPSGDARRDDRTNPRRHLSGTELGPLLSARKNGRCPSPRPGGSIVRYAVWRPHRAKGGPPRINKLTNRKRRCPPMPSRYLYRPDVCQFGDRPPLRDTLTGGRPPGRKLPDPCWGGLAIIGRNEAKCRPSSFSSENVILGLLEAAPNHKRTRG